MYYAARLSRTGESQGDKGLGSQDRYNGRGRYSMCFHGENVVIYEIVWKVSDVEAGLGVETLVCSVDGVVGSGVGSANE